MATTKLFFAGSGGQGVLTMGQMVTYAAMYADMNATWLPSYGPEMRGGTANCHVGISTEPIGAPMFTHPTELIAMNAPSIEKFGSAVRSGGSVFINSSVVKEPFTREDVSVYYIPCEDIAAELGNMKVANMVMLGAYIGATGALRAETAEAMIRAMFTGAKAKLVPLNLEALQRGLAAVQ